MSEDPLKRVYESPSELARAAAEKLATELLGGSWPKDRWGDLLPSDIDSNFELGGLVDENPFEACLHEVNSVIPSLVASGLPFCISNLELAMCDMLPREAP